MNFLIETDRLILRGFIEDDWPYFSQHFKEPEAQKNILKIQSDDSYLQKMFTAGLGIAKQKYRRSFLLTIVHKESLNPIGNCSLISAITGAHNSQIGWHLSESYRGLGFATETANGLLKLGFEKQLVAAIRADVFPDNSASIRVMEKIGMKPIRNGLITQWIRGYRYGERRAILRYQVTKNEWLEKLRSDNL